jgi:hypothetical protein
MADVIKAFPMRLILTLLIGQAFFLGVALALVDVAGNTLFLVDYGAEFLPYVYIITGVFVALIFFELAARQRRWILAQLISVVFIGQAIFYFLARLALTLPNARWVSVALMMLFPLGLQLKAITLEGQADRLLDLRQRQAGSQRTGRGCCKCLESGWCLSARDSRLGFTQNVTGAVSTARGRICRRAQSTDSSIGQPVSGVTT